MSKYHGQTFSNCRNIKVKNIISYKQTNSLFKVLVFCPQIGGNTLWDQSVRVILAQIDVNLPNFFEKRNYTCIQVWTLVSIQLIHPYLKFSNIRKCMFLLPYCLRIWKTELLNWWGLICTNSSFFELLWAKRRKLSVSVW